MSRERTVPEILGDMVANSITSDVIGGRLWCADFTAELLPLVSELIAREGDIVAFLQERRTASALDNLCTPTAPEES